MSAASEPANEITRPGALADLFMLGDCATAEFDALVKAAALVCDVPVASIILIDRQLPWITVNSGAPGDLTICAHAIHCEHLLEIPDAGIDPRFSDDPLFTRNPGLRFYAGAPLRLSTGEHVGSLCVSDHHARHLTTIQREALGHLADATAKALEARLALGRLQDEQKFVRFNHSRLRLIVDNAPSMMAYWDRDLNCVFANRACEIWFGVDPDGLVGKNLRELLGPELFALNRSHLDAVLAGNVQTFERMIPVPGGIIRYSLAYYVPEIIDGEAAGFVVQVTDVSDLKRAERSLQEAQRLGRIGSWEWSPQSDITTWSAELFHIMGLDPAAQAPAFAEQSKLYTPESWARLQDAVDRTLRLGELYALELQFVRRDGTTGWLEARGRAVFDAMQQVVVLHGTAQDITTRRALLAELAEQHELLHVTLQSIGDAVITTDAQGLVTWLNPVAAHMVGWHSDEAKGRTLAEVFHIIDEETRQLAGNPTDRSALEQGRGDWAANHTVLISRDGEEYCIEDSVAPIRGGSGELLGAVLVFHDVTEQRRQRREMTYRAQHDSLTGLVNRSEFEIRLNRTLTKARGDADVHTLMYIDLDQFKIINDTCGHTAGDKALQNVSTLLKSVVRTRDTVARLGGDEFAILLEHCTRENAETIAQQICDRLDDWRFIHDGKRFRIGASIGVVPIDGSWETPIAIMQAADRSCYAAKEGGRNRVHTWFEADQGLRARQYEMQWANRLENAFDEQRFRLFAQRIFPIVGNGCGHHLEVLLRLVESDGTVIAPSAFLPAAERFFLAARIDRMVLRKVVDRLVALPDLHAFDAVCVNISGQSIGDRAFHREAIAILAAAGALVCRCICLEITETAAITNMTDARHFIEQVKQLGVRIALDDFGAGAATFGYLKSLPIDVLKIDGQFVRDLVSDPLDEAAVRCFVDVARIMGVKVVAECVESTAVLSRLKEMGVDYAQGYLLHRPEPIENVLCYTQAIAAE